jgi:hypothetical protein
MGADRISTWDGSTPWAAAAAMKASTVGGFAAWKLVKEDVAAAAAAGLATSSSICRLKPANCWRRRPDAEGGETTRLPVPSLKYARSHENWRLAGAKVLYAATKRHLEERR